MFAGNIFDSNPRTYAPNNQNNPGYVFEAEQIINFKSLVIMKRFDGMRDRYQGMIPKMFVEVCLCKAVSRWTNVVGAVLKDL